MHWLKNFNTVTAGSLAILLTSCTNFKAPTTLFITFGASQEREFFENDTADIKTFLNEYTETFRRSNPNINIAYIGNFYALWFSVAESLEASSHN